MAYIAVLGYGTVGSGVVETLNTNEVNIDLRSGEEVRLKYVLDLRDFPGDPVQPYIVHDFDVIVNDDDVKVVVEVMGGIQPAFTYVKQCLMKGKSVVTSNKELVALHGVELLDTAKAHNANFLFEASVGGGIPIIRPLNQSLTAEDIYEIKGILNGTTNFILTKMKKDKMSFDEALSLAQDKGYAERKPDADVLGYDTCRKIAILSSLAFGRLVDFGDIYTEGITEITFRDMQYAEALDGVIKLVATAKKENGRYETSVRPQIVSFDSPLANVDGVFNAILVKGNIIGEVMFYGMGAGKLPTASAVVSDVIDCIKNFGTDITHSWSASKIELESNADSLSNFLVRLTTIGYNNLSCELKKRFGNLKIVKLNGCDDELAVVINGASDAVLRELKELSGDGFINAVKID